VTPGRAGRARAGAALGVALVLAGCATKRDVRELRAELAALRARQDSLFAQVLAAQRALGDSLRRTGELVLRVRGDLGNQLVALEQQAIQIQELLGQSQQHLAALRQAAESRNQQLAGAVPAVDTAPASGSAEGLYRLGVEQLERGNPSTARAAFRELLSRYPTHALAPDAQFQLAETYYREKQPERALEELEQVVTLFPNSPAAPRALYRAGVIAEEQGNRSRARTYFTRVQRGYPRSEEARLAAERLRRPR